MELKYAANFVSMISYLPEFDMLPGASGAASSHAAQVRSLIATAQGQYRQGHYADAINSYKAAQSLIYGLINPRHTIDIFLADAGIMLPVGALIEEKIAEASLKLAEVIRTEARPPVYPVTATGAPTPAELTRLDKIGFIDSAVPLAVSDSTTIGVSLLAQGQAHQAIDALRDGLAGLGQSDSAEAQSARASILLNLSSALVLAGNNQEALDSASKANDLFSHLHDDVGSAQALHNQAIAAQKLGQADQSTAFFDKASTTLKNIAGPIAQNAPTFDVIRPNVAGNEERANPASIRRPRVPSNVEAQALTPLSQVTAAVVQPSLSFDKLDFIQDRSASTLAVRWDGAAAGWGGVPVLNQSETAQQTRNWSIGIESGSTVASVNWNEGVRPPAADLLTAVYQPRLTATTLGGIVWRPKETGEFSLWLTHLYSFIIPQALGDCYNALGNYSRAEQYYLQAAEYSYINVELEGTALWTRVANNKLQWGDFLYKNEALDEARAVYGKLIGSDGTVPAAEPLYTLPAFASASAQAQQVIGNLSDPGSTGANPAIGTPILVVWARWQYLSAGLDYYGTSFTPIFTFEYLQQVARAFAQQSVQAEREYVEFQVHAEAEAATRRDLEGAVALADAETAIRNQQYQAAKDESAAMDAAVNLANLRVTQAQADLDTYRTSGYWQYITQSIATAHGAHEDWHEDEIRRLAADMEHGSWEGNPGKLAAAATLLGGQKSYEYQLQRLQESIADSAAAVPIAQSQAAAAAHREEAARLTYEAGKLHADLARDALAAFDNEVFTPELWTRMALVMRELSRGYQEWAIRVAKLMERAYNFETDRGVNIIKLSYPMGATNGLLGSDYLLRDIDSFTYDLIVHTRSKVTQIKDVISLANEYPFQFYDFLRTGKMSFETTLRDFDTRHPGFYAQQVQAVELEVIGLLPPEGLRGTLRGGNVSRYRTASNEEKVRIHTTDTLALSDYTVRNDAFVYRQDPRLHGLFEGQGVASTWHIDVPRRSNNIDYRLITDVRMVVYYTARYDADLSNLVLTRPSLPGELIHVRALLPRFDFPEAWYTFLDSGQLEFTVTPNYLPRNEENFKLDKLALQLIVGSGASPAGVSMTIKVPGAAPVTMVTDANGNVASEAGNALQNVMNGDLLGPWSIQVTPPAGSALLASNGTLRGDLLEQLALTIQYAFAWPA